VNEGALAVHEIKLVVNAGKDLSDGGGVADHAAGTHDLGQITTWDNSWWLVINSTLEAGGRPISVDSYGSLGRFFRHNMSPKVLRKFYESIQSSTTIR